MINRKQLDRLVLKMVRLKDAYADFLIKEERVQRPLLNGKPIQEGEKWGEDFEYGNFEFVFDVPFSNPYLFVETGGVEHLLLADGKPFGMTDYLPNGKDAIFRCHKYVSLKNIKRGTRITVEAYASHTFYGTMPFEKIQTFSVNGYRPERIYKKISIVEIDGELKRFLDNMELLVSYFRCMTDDDFRKIAVYQVYEKLFELLTVLPHTQPDMAEIAEANSLIEEFFASLKDEGYSTSPHIGIIGHSHLDTAWLWPVAETRHKAVRTASNAVTLLKEYPEYRFIMSSVLYMDWIKKDYPALFEEIKQLVKEGRFEPNGASWVECECNLTDGESIIRQFLRGKRFLREEFGYEADVFWLPDTFGYSAALPQILQGCKVPYFLTTKLSWNDTNKFPYESFTWRGIDGSEVLVHFNTIQSKADPEFLTARMGKRLNKHLTKNVLVAYGYGDGGGGPDRDMVENAVKTQKSYPYAEVEHESVSKFMERIAKEELPLYEGELYLELHRGTLTTNHDIKRLNRKLEGALKDAEIVGIASGDLESKTLVDEAYETLMVNQFHDILPGTCIHEAHAIAIAENTSALNKVNGYLQGSRYFNTLPFARTEILESEGGVQSYVDLDGKQVSVDKFSFEGYGYAQKQEAEGCPFTVTDTELKTPYYTAELSGGAFKSLVFMGRELSGGLLNAIRLYEDVPYLWDNWDIDADYRKKPLPVKLEKVEVVSVGALELRLRASYSFAVKSTLTQDIVFYAHTPLIKFENKVDWNGSHKLLKAEFETNISTPTIRSEVQFGYIERPTTRNTSEDQAKYEVCNHKWSDVSEPRFGLAILNDCKYGIGIDGKTLSLSLIKSGKRPDPIGEEGVKYFSYALLPHKGGFTAESVTLPAYAFNRAPVKASEGLLSPVKGVTEPNVIVEAMKYAEDGDGVILRLYESERSLTKTTLLLNGEYAVYECDMLEEEPKYLGTGTEIDLSFRPFEIKTLRIKKV